MGFFKEVQFSSHICSTPFFQNNCVHLWANGCFELAQNLWEKTTFESCFFEKDNSALQYRYALYFKYSIPVVLFHDGTWWNYLFKQVHVPLRKDTLLKAAVICLNNRNTIVA